jgi:Fe-S cluster assembly protein SufD
MIEVTEEKNIYLNNFEQFERELGEVGGSWLHRLRKAALKRFVELGFPGTRNEEWKFTNVAPIAKIPFKMGGSYETNDFASEEVRHAALGVDVGNRLVFVDGRYSPELSRLPSLPFVASLEAAFTSRPRSIEPHLGRYAKYQDQAFTALNTAFTRDGAFISIPKGAVVDEPIYLLFVTTRAGEGSVSHPRNLILAGANSRATIVERYMGLQDEVYFTNAVTEIVAAADCVVDYYKLQLESEEAFHIATTQVHQERGSKVTSHYISMGGALVRNDVNVVLDAEHCECTLNGLYMANGQQHMDSHTLIDHAKPYCTSHELYKGILDGKAHGVFNGKIFVRQDAQKTDAKQTNQTLLLSDNAVINTKPQLEIYADDVKCTHGATIGQIQDDALFYLRSRGIGLEAARSLMTYAFANEIIGRIKINSIRAELEDILLVTQHLPRVSEAEVAS